MKILLKTLAFWLLLVSSGLAAQTPYEVFKEAAGAQSVLFRGRQATQYAFHFNGNPYWDMPEFRLGNLEYNEKIYENVLLNIDAVSQDVLVKYEESMPAISLYREDVGTVFIGGNKYRNLSAEGVEGAPVGFFLVLLEGGGQEVFMQVTKALQKAVDNRNGKPIGYYDPDYDPTVLEFFDYTAKYYSLKDGVLTKVGRRKALKYVANE